jgi:hypothetical protein
MLVNSDQSTHPLDNAAMLRESEGVCVENGIGRNFHFAFPAMTVYCRLPLLRSFSAFLPEPKNRTRPAHFFHTEYTAILKERLNVS